MTRFLTAGVAVLVLSGTASAQRVRPAAYERLTVAPAAPRVHRMEIYNGTVKTVAYFSSNLSRNDRAILRDLAEAESDAVAAAVAEDPATEPLPPPPADSAVDARELREHRYHLARAWAAGSPGIRRAMGMDDLPVVRRKAPTKGIRPAAGDDAVPVAVLTLREGNVRVLAAKLEESGAWLVVTATNGKTARLKAGDVLSIEAVGK